MRPEDIATRGALVALVHRLEAVHQAAIAEMEVDSYRAKRWEISDRFSVATIDAANEAGSFASRIRSMLESFDRRMDNGGAGR